MATNTPTADRKKPEVKELPRERTFWKDDFPIVRQAVIVFVLCALVGAGLIISSQHLLETQKQAVTVAHALENKTREKLRIAQIELSEIYEFQPKYNQLVDSGFVGAERRLEWVEAIQSIQKKAKLQPISYDIVEQQVFQVEPTTDIGTLELRGSRMTVKMDLLHEVDLLRFFNGLRGGQIYDLQSCSLHRLPAPEPNVLLPLLNAECTLYWITVARPVAETSENTSQAGK